MGNPDSGSSTYQHDQPQIEYDLQPQEYQYEGAATHEEFSTSTYDQQAQQQVEPPQQPPVPVAQQQQLQQPAQYPPPQTNQPYGAQPARSVQFPTPMQQNGNQNYQNRPSQAGAYQQGSQTMPTQPVQFPPQNSQNNQTYTSGPTQPGVNRPGSQPMATEPVQFPPGSQQKSPVYSSGPNQPAAYPPFGQQPMAQQTPVNFPPPSPQDFPPQVGYQSSQAAQFQQQNGPQVQYANVQNGAVAGFPVQSTGAPPMQKVNYQGWTSGLFDCMNDPMNALVTAFFPCLTFGQVAEIVDEGHTSCGTSGLLYGGISFCIGIPFILSCTYRTKLRNKFGLPEAPAPDWVTHFLCEWCALCQEYRELQARGWDPSIGWQGNVARNQNMNMQQATMMVPVNQRMMA